MRVSLKIVGERDGFQYGVRKQELYSVVEVEDVVFTSQLTASFLRAVADEIDGRGRAVHEVDA